MEGGDGFVVAKVGAQVLAGVCRQGRLRLCQLEGRTSGLDIPPLPAHMAPTLPGLLRLRPRPQLADGSWSAPLFITLKSLGIGFTLGWVGKGGVGEGFTLHSAKRWACGGGSEVERMGTMGGDMVDGLMA